MYDVYYLVYTKDSIHLDFIQNIRTRSWYIIETNVN